MNTTKTKHLGSPATCLGAPRFTVMYSVCIVIYVSRNLYSNPSTHAISGLAAVCQIYTPHHPVHLHYPCIYIQPPALLEDEHDWACLWCPWRGRSSELSDAFGGRDWASLEIQLETEIEWTQRCTCRPGSSEFGDALGGHDQTNLQAIIERVWRCTLRPWSSEFGDTLGCRHRARLEKYL